MRYEMKEQCEQARPQHRGLRPLLGFSNSDVGSLTSPTNVLDYFLIVVQDALKQIVRPDT